MQMAIHRSSSHADPHERPFITSPPDCSFAQNTVSAAPTHPFGTTIDAVKRIIQGVGRLTTRGAISYSVSLDER